MSADQIQCGIDPSSVILEMFNFFKIPSDMESYLQNDSNFYFSDNYYSLWKSLKKSNNKIE